MNMSKRTYPLSETGYVTTWLVSGRLDTQIDPETRTIVDQGKYEYHLKMTIHDDDLKSVPENMFVFPLVEPASEIEAKFDFSMERDDYFKRSAENLRELIEHNKLMELDDLPF